MTASSLVTASIPGYTIERLLGRGGSGEVWAGRNDVTGERVALKRLRPGAGGPDRARLRHEAALLTAFRHPNVIGLRGVLGTAEGLVLVLDLASGGSLADVLASRTRLRSGQVVALFTPLAEALAAAHAAGLVHGDVSPANVLLDEQGWAYLADFGTARLAGSSEPASGTSGYIDPAVRAGEAPTSASDVYSLAAVAARSLTGSPLAESADGVQRWADHAHTFGVPSSVAVVICAALARTPRHRPSAEAFAEQLRVACAPEPLGQHAPVGVEAIAARPLDPVGPDALTRLVPRPPAGSGATAERRPRWVPGWLRRGGASAAHGGVAGSDRWAAVRLAERRPSVPLIRRLAVSMVVVAIAAVGGIVWTRLNDDSVPATPAPISQEDEWSSVLTRLDARRQQAFAAADKRLLGGVYSDGAPPAAADARAIESLIAARARAVDVRHELRAVREVRTGGGRAELDVTDRMPAYRIVAADGAVVRTVPARGDRTFRVTLVRAAGQWRIATITELRA
jgi:hypothetical protein